tara:strand:+ start:864 stop:1409 length:546 start_codon:yes stop_codon:yes gene_type:complete
MLENKIIGLVPGAMKPFHKGHHFLIKEAVKDCDEVIVYTTTKNRDNIYGQRMKLAWTSLIHPNLPSSVSIEFVSSPIGSVFEYLYDGTSKDRIYRIYGGTEDIHRFSKRIMIQRFPDLQVTNVAEDTPEIFTRDQTPAKGEWVRNAIRTKDIQRFKEYLPEFLKPLARNYLEILTRGDQII